MSIIPRYFAINLVKLLPTALAVATGSMAMQAHAVAVTYTFTGTISQFSDSPSKFDGIAGGDSFSGTFTYDPAAPNRGGGEFDSLSHIESSVHGIKLTSDSLAGYVDTNLAHIPGSYDYLSFSTYPGINGDALKANSGSSVCGGTCVPYFQQLTFVNSAGSVFSTSEKLPATLNLSSFTNATFYFNWLTPTASQLLTGGHLTSLTPQVSAVPEPSTYALLAMGFSFIALRSRRTRRLQR